MQLVLQPDGTEVCGPASVAMIAGVDLNEAVRACGTTTLAGGVKVKELVRGLKALGVRCGRAKTGFWYHGDTMHKTRDIPAFCLATMDRTDDKWCHAVVIKDGFVYDPGINYPIPLQVYEDFILYRAYGFSRKGKNGRKYRVSARWQTFIPILEVPQKNDIVR